MLKHNEVREILDWLVKKILCNVISHWYKEENNYYFFWQDKKGVLNGFILYNFMPDNIIRIAINHNSIYYLPNLPNELLKIKNQKCKPSWSCNLTFLPEELAPSIAWLKILILHNQPQIYFISRLPKGFISVGNEIFTERPYYFSKKALTKIA